MSSTETTGFTYARDPRCGYKVFDTAGTYLGDVAKRAKSGWSSRVPEDAEPTPADRRTRKEAAERLILIRRVYEDMQRREEGARPPEGYELVDVLDLREGDTVRTPGMLTTTGNVKHWSGYGPHVVRRIEPYPDASGARVYFAYHADGGHHYPHTGQGGYRTIARRIETPESLAARAADKTARHFSPRLDDFDFMVLIAYQCRVSNEHSEAYAHANWPWEFDDPTLTERASTLEGMLALVAEHRHHLDAWWRRCPSEEAVYLLNQHTQEVFRREEHAALWALRRADGYIIPIGQESLARTMAARPDSTSVLMCRDVPGGEWRLAEAGVEATALIPLNARSAA